MWIARAHTSSSIARRIMCWQCMFVDEFSLSWMLLYFLMFLISFNFVSLLLQHVRSNFRFLSTATRAPFFARLASNPLASSEKADKNNTSASKMLGIETRFLWCLNTFARSKTLHFHLWATTNEQNIAKCKRRATWTFDVCQHVDVVPVAGFFLFFIFFFRLPFCFLILLSTP